MSTPPKIGGMKLHDSVIPDLTAGLYRVSSSLDISDAGTALAAPAEQQTFFDVFAPRFVLSPDEVADCFPPPAGKGAFSERLPHIALWRRTLPWTRKVSDSDQPGQAPWLALLVLKESEAVIETGTLSSVLPADLVASLGNQDAIDGDPEVAVLKINSTSTFQKVMPHKHELALLSHVRQVNLADTELAGADDDGWFSVVVANRLPLSDASDVGTKYMACLVSLEGRSDVFSVQRNDPAPALILLYSWRFTANDAGGTFEELASNLDLAAFGAGNGDDGLVDDRGRLTIEHTGHDGTTGNAFYRSPLLGVSAQFLPEDASDITLPAAYELGRLLGIADGRFLREMVDWHRTAEAEIRARLEAEELAAHFSSLLHFDGNLTVASMQQSLLTTLNTDNLAVADIGSITFLGEIE